ncbi:hypothetical protein BN946_scf185008.g78 [Trametes cinnabarina]|uniref:BTB domain-containing protein n=1 Tax=Pycnoporus cinnabarinus TaxID=5643 RepID=A0A060SGM7_PYCCI|nr:hypothetical protein BN946_scf185008.g78 [Trametes cinnabarina]
MEPSDIPTVLAAATCQCLPDFRRAAEPFDRGDSDFILRSSDGVDFFVHRIILSLSSPLFSTMLSLPQPTDDTSEGVKCIRQPIINLTEDSETLDTFLRLCYPLVDPPLASFDLIRGALATATKYDAAVALVSAKKALVQPHLLEDDPLRCFSIACCYGLEEEAEIAAERAVIDDRVVGGVCPELDEIPAAAYYRLFKLQRTKKVVDSPRHPGLQCYSVDFADVSPFRQHPSCAIDASARTPLRSVDYPFEASDADLILRSKDDVDFRVHQMLIAFASPNILQLAPRIAQIDTLSGLPVHQLDEDSVVADAMLRMCYPVDHPRAMDTDVLIDVLEAAGKYRMKKVMQTIQYSWPTFAEQESLRLYLVAARCGWDEEARAAARRLVQRHDVASIYAHYVPSMEKMANGPYRRLLLYVIGCSAAASATCELALDSQRYGRTCPECRDRFPVTFTTDTELPWRETGTISLRTEFKVALKSRPTRSTLSATTDVSKSFLSATVATPKCSYASSSKSKCRAARNLRWAFAVLESYGAAVERAVEQVSPTLTPRKSV